MTTTAQVEANRNNGLLSAGPKTAEGKAKSSKNALRHGLRSAAPVLPNECIEEWEEHHLGILQSLRPSGALETALAERVALSLWRLRRTAAYETARIAVAVAEEEARGLSTQDEADLSAFEKAQRNLGEKEQRLSESAEMLRVFQTLPQAADAELVNGGCAYAAFQKFLDALPMDAGVPDVEEGKEFFAVVGVPHDEVDRPYDWEGWTFGMVRKGLEEIAKDGPLTSAKVLARAVKEQQEVHQNCQNEVEALRRKVEGLRHRVRDRQQRQSQRCVVLPDQRTLDKITRYESHLSRQMLQALHELQRLQAARAGKEVPPPAALDVTVAGPDSDNLPAIEDLSRD